jgi:hypothetical protein
MQLKTAVGKAGELKNPYFRARRSSKARGRPS